MLLHDGPAGAAPLAASPAPSPGPCSPDLSVIVPLLRDRGLADRPGALRLLGVGVSGLTSVRQLTFDEL